MGKPLTYDGELTPVKRDGKASFYFYLPIELISRRIDNMEAALLPQDLVSTNRLAHGCTDGCDWLAARRAVIGCQSRSCSRFVETKVVCRTQLLKGLINAASILSFLLGLYELKMHCMFSFYWELINCIKW